MSRPRCLDLFCCAGGAAMGLHRAGFDVVGVDIKPQPRYPFPFVQSDALRPPFKLIDFDFIWASPPCQKHSSMTKRWGKKRIESHADLIEPTRKMLKDWGGNYIIENVPGAPLDKLVMLCGTMFGLRTKGGAQLRRHRFFETNCAFVLTPPCNHLSGSSIGVYGGGQHPNRRIPATIPVYGHTGGSSNRDGLDFSSFTVEDRKDAMGIDWMTCDELSEAIPPAYSEFLGRQVIKLL